MVTPLWFITALCWTTENRGHSEGSDCPKVVFEMPSKPKRMLEYRFGVFQEMPDMIYKMCCQKILDPFQSNFLTPKFIEYLLQNCQVFFLMANGQHHIRICILSQSKGQAPKIFLAPRRTKFWCRFIVGVKQGAQIY